MNAMLKRCFHLGALIVLGAIVVGGNRASASAATPVSACTVLAPDTSYFLTGDVIASGTCFTVQTNTTLDLKKHTIKGNGSGYGITDGGNPAQNVQIGNGTITRFEDGIEMESGGLSRNLAVDKMTVTLNGDEGIFSDSCCNSITNSTVTNNSDDGIQIDSCCNTFSNDNTSSNGEVGLFGEGCCSLAYGVTSNGNHDDDGIELEDGANSVENSTANNNHGEGIDLGGGENGVESSTANGNSGDGIYFGGTNDNVDHSTANGNGGDGIVADGGSNLVSYSTANRNGDDGIDLTGGDLYNIVVNDTTQSNGFIGVLIECNANVAHLTSHSNSASDLCEIEDGPCANIGNFLEHPGCP